MRSQAAVRSAGGGLSRLAQGGEERRGPPTSAPNLVDPLARFRPRPCSLRQWPSPDFSGRRPNSPALPLSQLFRPPRRSGWRRGMILIPSQTPAAAAPTRATSCSWPRRASARSGAPRRVALHRSDEPGCGAAPRPDRSTSTSARSSPASRSSRCWRSKPGLRRQSQRRGARTSCRSRTSRAALRPASRRNCSNPTTPQLAPIAQARNARPGGSLHPSRLHSQLPARAEPERSRAGLAGRLFLPLPRLEIRPCRAGCSAACRRLTTCRSRPIISPTTRRCASARTRPARFRLRFRRPGLNARRAGVSWQTVPRAARVVGERRRRAGERGHECRPGDR